MIFRRGLVKYEAVAPALKHCVPVAQAIECMKINGDPYKEFQKCFACKKKLTDEEYPYSSYVFSLGPRFFCEECAKKIREN